MTVSSRGRYALRMMLDLAHHHSGGFVSLKDICARQEISIKYLEQIVALLCKAGLLQSARGAQGGYRLAKQPEEYTIGEILRLTEGGLSPVQCLQQTPNECSRSEECLSLKFWQGLDHAINSYVDSVTLGDLLEKQPAQKKSGNTMPVYYL